MDNFETVHALMSDIEGLSIELAEQVAASLTWSAVFGASNSLVQSYLLGQEGFRFRPRDPDLRAQRTREAEERAEVMAALGAQFAPRVAVKHLPKLGAVLTAQARTAPAVSLEEKAARTGTSISELRAIRDRVDREALDDAAFEQEVRDSSHDQLANLYYSILEGRADSKQDLSRDQLMRAVETMAKAVERERVRRLEDSFKSRLPMIAARLEADARLFGDLSERLQNFVLKLMDERDRGEHGEELAMFSPESLAAGEGEQYDPTTRPRGE
jgi:hypothetical protein